MQGGRIGRVCAAGVFILLSLLSSCLAGKPDPERCVLYVFFGEYQCIPCNVALSRGLCALRESNPNIEIKLVLVREHYQLHPDFSKCALPFDFTTYDETDFAENMQVQVNREEVKKPLLYLLRGDSVIYTYRDYAVPFSTEPIKAHCNMRQN